MSQTPASRLAPPLFRNRAYPTLAVDASARNTRRHAVSDSPPAFTSVRLLVAVHLWPDSTEGPASTPARPRSVDPHGGRSRPQAPHTGQVLADTK